MRPDTLPGKSFPIGATVYPEGVNFCIFSRNATAVELLFFDDADDAAPGRVIHLDPARNRTFYYWHVFVPGVCAGQLYGYRAHGPFDPARGHRFDGARLLLDPYTRAVAIGARYDRQAAIRPGDNCAQAMKSVVVDPTTYPWEGDEHVRLPYASTVIYELHVAGFTRHPSSGLPPERRGTYTGLIEKIPYLKSLGITAVELLPVQQFDPEDAPAGLRNYWGYSPLALFAPHSGYASRSDPLGPVYEFRDMVKAFHRAGIEVILDVVFNHTAEGNQAGPTFSFRGLENRAYYILEAGGAYADYTGCGNTLNANHSIVRRLIVDCLRYWFTEMHVDGFRFDLASVMARDEHGRPLENPPILWEIESDPALAGAKIIAEAWDAAGLYQVGSFIGHRWAEWNGRFRDDARRFVRAAPGDANTASHLAARITGSPDLYRRLEREPNRSINFITCHDGFTLNDLVSYNEKHNQANGEQNRDGTSANYSWNCGIEGPTDDPAIESLRLRQIKNLLVILFVSQGTPMLLMGDEVRRTQQGNNNAYCQDNPISWLDWCNVEQHADLLRFTRELIAFTQSLTLFRREEFWTVGAAERDEATSIIWHGVCLGQPDWGRDSHSLAFELRCPARGEHLYVALNAYWEALTFQLPPLPPGECWQRVVDTAQPAPDDFCAPGTGVMLTHGRYQVAARSTIILKSMKINRRGAERAESKAMAGQRPARAG